MFKYIINSPEIFKNLIRVPLLSKFLTLNIESFDKVQTWDIYSKLIKHFRYGDVTGKETYCGRFTDLDDHIMVYLDANMSFHDVGCSTGVTSMDLYEKCRSKNKNLDLTVSDKYTKFYFDGSYVRKIYDQSGSLKQIYIGKVLLDKNISTFFFLSKLLFYPCAILVGKKNDISNLVEISLMSPSIRSLHSSNNLRVIDYDIFSNPIQKFDFVRCMNVLNRSYFSDKLLVVGLSNLIQSLQQGGLLLIGRTDTFNVNKATLFQKVDECLVVLNHFSGGAEIFDLVEKNFKVEAAI